MRVDLVRANFVVLCRCLVHNFADLGISVLIDILNFVWQRFHVLKATVLFYDHVVCAFENDLIVLIA